MRSLITFAVLALISAQLEFISDVPAFLGDAPGDELAATLLDHGDGPGETLEHDGCDHCCHGASHLTVIVGDQFAAVVHLTHFQRTAVRADLVSIVETPPVPPPIA